MHGFGGGRSRKIDETNKVKGWLDVDEQEAVQGKACFFVPCRWRLIWGTLHIAQDMGWQRPEHEGRWCAAVSPRQQRK